MRAWRRLLGNRVRLHLLSGKTVEGRLCYAAGGVIELQDAVHVKDRDRDDLPGVTGVPVGLIELYQILEP